MTPTDAVFTCFACHHGFSHNHANLDAKNNLICGDCYIANPPPQDVEIVFAQVIAHIPMGSRNVARHFLSCFLGVRMREFSPQDSMRFILLIPILATVLQADPITVIETQTGSRFGNSNLNYFYDVPPLPGQVTATIRGGVNCSACEEYLTATIDFTMDLYTPGAARDGIGLLQLYLDSDGDAFTGLRVNGSIGPYTGPYPINCPKGISCNLYGYFPFELGTPFTVHLYGLANSHAYGGGGFSAFANVQLFELPDQGGGRTGSPVQILLLPEPSGATLAATGIVAMMIFIVRRRRIFPL